MNNTHNYAEQAKRSRTNLFGEFNLARRLTTSAWHQSKEKHLVLAEQIESMRNLIEMAQKEIAECERKGKL